MLIFTQKLKASLVLRSVYPLKVPLLICLEEKGLNLIYLGLNKGIYF